MKPDIAAIVAEAFAAEAARLVAIREEDIRADRRRLEAEHGKRAALARALRDAGIDPRDHADEPPRRRRIGGSGSR